MIYVPNLLLVAGTGTKSGKTSFACKIIGQFRDHKITAIKISPHFHTPTSGLKHVAQGEGYGIFLETNMETGKDTSRMLAAGADQVYLALVWDAHLAEVFEMIMKEIPGDTPVVCESPALRNHIEPGMFVIMSSGTENKRQDLEYLQKLPHLDYRLQDLDKIDRLPVFFKDGKWITGSI